MEAALHFMDKDPAAVAASMAHTQSELAARAAERAAKSGVSQAGLDALRKEREWFAAQNTSVNSVEHWLKENPDRANDFIKRSGLSLDQYEESSDDLPGGRCLALAAHWRCAFLCLAAPFCVVFCRARCDAMVSGFDALFCVFLPVCLSVSPSPECDAAMVGFDAFSCVFLCLLCRCLSMRSDDGWF